MTDMDCTFFVYLNDFAFFENITDKELNFK